MTRVRWTTDAADQVEGIIKRIQEGNPAAALRVAQTLLDTIAHLEAFPHLGRPGQEVEGTRELVCPPYVIVYRLKDDVAEILYIWTARRTGAEAYNGDASPVYCPALRETVWCGSTGYQEDAASSRTEFLQ